MSRLEQIKQLNRMLLAELPQYREQAEAFPPDETSQRRLLRSLMNVRPPVPASAEFLAVQDAYLRERLVERGITRLTDLTPVRPGMYLSPEFLTDTRKPQMCNRDRDSKRDPHLRGAAAAVGVRRDHAAAGPRGRNWPGKDHKSL